jgi:hypothetical protein
MEMLSWASFRCNDGEGRKKWIRDHFQMTVNETHSGQSVISLILLTDPALMPEESLLNGRIFSLLKIKPEQRRFDYSIGSS